MSIEDLANDRLTVEKRSGETLGPFKGVVSSSKITLLDDQVHIDDGDFVSRELPNGHVERYAVEDAEFSNSPFDAIPSCWDLTVRKASKPKKAGYGSQTINIGSAENLQIGNHNTQTVLTAVQQLASIVAEAEGSAAEKAEAKGLLREFLEHPLVAALVGAGAGAILR